ncbi:MAG: DUF2306 domain-containing protein [Pseudomonadota bacterium]
MTFVPLLAAPAVVIAHAFAAIAALVLGVVQLAAPKGTVPHRVAGWLWVGLMATVAATSFFIHTICTFGPFSVIHGLSVFTLVALPGAVTHARRHEVAGHRRAMRSLFFWALIVAGLFTLWPGRLMHAVVFGTTGQYHACR